MVLMWGKNLYDHMFICMSPVYFCIYPSLCVYHLIVPFLRNKRLWPRKHNLHLAYFLCRLYTLNSGKEKNDVIVALPNWQDYFILFQNRWYSQIYLSVSCVANALHRRAISTGITSQFTYRYGSNVIYVEVPLVVLIKSKITCVLNIRQQCNNVNMQTSYVLVISKLCGMKWKLCTHFSSRQINYFSVW